MTQASGASEARPDSRAARVAPAQHCAAFPSHQRGVPEFSPRREAHLASLIGFGGDLHGRNLASALMRSRVHNRTCDRGGEPIRLNGGGHCPWSSSDRTGGALSKTLRCGRQADPIRLGTIIIIRALSIIAEIEVHCWRTLSSPPHSQKGPKHGVSAYRVAPWRPLNERRRPARRESDAFCLVSSQIWCKTMAREELK
jgi:hypothetical protein